MVTKNDQAAIDQLREMIAQARATQQAAPEAPTLTLDNAPVGTLAPSIGGGHWYRTAQGWKWNGPDGSGSTFPMPGGDWSGKLIAPEAPATEPSLIEMESKVATSRADSNLFNDEAMRLRRVVRALGMESEVPEDDATLRGCLFAVLGQIAYKLERATPAATTASASGEPEGWRAFIENCAGKGVVYGGQLASAAKELLSRATAPSRNADPLDENAVEKWLAENIDSYFSHAPDYGSDIMWASVADIQLFLRAALTQQSAAQAPGRDSAKAVQIFTCIGKGGEYELIGYSNGAGPKRGESIVVYCDTSKPDILYHRSATDFRERMEWLGGRAAQAPHAGADTERDAARFQWIEENCRTEGGGRGFTVFVPVDHEDIGCGIDAALAATEKKEQN